MSETNIDGVHTIKRHPWGKPIPGAGSMRVCKRCGEKETDHTTQSECIGRPELGPVESLHDYDPI
jgi:hypothetical protein